MTSVGHLIALAAILGALTSGAVTSRTDDLELSQFEEHSEAMAKRDVHLKNRTEEPDEIAQRDEVVDFENMNWRNVEQMQAEHGRELKRLRLEKTQLDEDVERLRKQRREDMNDEFNKSKHDREKLNEEIISLINKTLEYQTENIVLKFKSNELIQKNSLLVIQNEKLFNESGNCNSEVNKLGESKSGLSKQVKEMKEQKEAVDLDLKLIQEKFDTVKSKCATTESQEVARQENGTQGKTPQLTGELEVELELCSNKSQLLGLVTLKGRHYFVADKKNTKSWHDALLFCRQFDMDLVNIETKEEFDIIYLHLEQRFKGDVWTNMWIGGTDLFAEGHWVLTGTGQPVKYTNWQTGQPDGKIAQNCLILHRPAAGKWYDNPCATLDPFICENKDPCKLDCGANSL